MQNLNEKYVSKKLTTKRLLNDNNLSYAIAFAHKNECSTTKYFFVVYRNWLLIMFCLKHIKILMRRDHLFFLNFIHNINEFKWKFFNLMIRDEQNSWWFCVYMLISNENDDIIVVFLRCMKKWTRAWRFRYAVIDDFVAKQRIVRLIFRDLKIDEQEMNHFLCRTHSKRTLNRNLVDDACKKTRKHLYSALYYRKFNISCEKNIKVVKIVALDSKKTYIERKWWNTRRLWTMYARQHLCLLLQIMIINVVKLWHHSFKTHVEN